MKRDRLLVAAGLVVLTLGVAERVHAATTVWGGGTGSWATAANWIGGVAPGANDTASFTGWAPMNRSGWTVSASVGVGPSNATDGSWNTRWTTGVPAASGQWFKIDLGSTQTFSRVVLDDTNDAADFPPGYDVYVSNDGTTWGTSIAGGTGSTALTTIDLPAQRARYIKIQLNGGATSWWSIREAFVYTTGRTDDTQLARNGWTASASLNAGAVYNAIDGALSSRWDTGTNAASGQWFKIDLGAPATVDRVDFSSYTDSNDYPPSYIVQLSTDDVTYGSAVASGTGSAAFTSATFSPQTARYVLITCKSVGLFYWSIHDLNIYGTARGATVSSAVSLGGLILAKGSVAQAAGASLALSGAYAQSAGTFTGGSSSFGVGGTFTVSGGMFKAGRGNVTIEGASTLSGGTVTLGAGTTAFHGALDVTGGTLIAASGPVTVARRTIINGAGTINAGSSTFTFSGAVAIGSGTAGAFNANSATVTFAGPVTLQDGGLFEGNTGSGTFSAAPNLASGTFLLADAGSTGRWTFSQSTTFSAGVALAFPSSGGELSVSPTKTLTINGSVTSTAGSSATVPKIDCNDCTSSQGIAVGFGASSRLNVDGLEIDNSIASGVTIAGGATIARLSRLKFLNNVGGAGSTHLVLTLGTALVVAPGCYFDASAAHNVALYGSASAPAGAQAIFENRGVATNGAGAGASRDLDGDVDGDNVGDSASTSPYFGSVVQWVTAAPLDTSGNAVGYPTAAFDWNSFEWYGVYVAYRDASGVGTADVLWKRNDDGSAAYSYSIPQSSGDLLGTPKWDTVDETVSGVDANGDGDKLDTGVHVVYLATTAGHIIKLIDSGAALVRPGGAWSSDFTDARVSTISSPLRLDQTNLYFGGTDGSGLPRFFGVQVAGGANEKTLQKSTGPLTTIVTMPTFGAFSGSLYAFARSVTTSIQAYVYRLNVTAAYVQSSFNGLTATVNDAVSLVNGRVYAVTDGGTLHVLAASNLDMGGLTNLTGFPYQRSSGTPIQRAPWVDGMTNYTYFGDDGGSIYVVDGAGAAMAGYPYTLASSPKITASPMYLQRRGVIAVGASDGYLYFIDRRNLSGVPNVFKRFRVANVGSVSTVAYNTNTAAYMVSSTDGRLVFIDHADVADPTPMVE